ncbi:MAG: hypothetical protein LRZ94_00755 [Candidatus Pacebacteria bacterium]|nr:hypothetical protein [Candidatus Paceibacterota bacterium]
MDNKKKRYLKLALIIFLLFCGVILVFSLRGNQNFLKNTEAFLMGADRSIDIQRIKSNIENMDEEEISETIKKIELKIKELESRN